MFMFEQLISLKKPMTKCGVVVAMKGKLFLAQQLDNAGNIVKQAPHYFKSLTQAKHWLTEQGIHTISLRCTPNYYEAARLGT